MSKRNNSTALYVGNAKGDQKLEEFLLGRNQVRLVCVSFGCGVALIVLIGSIILVPPPQRKWPKKTPLCGLLPWCLLSRLLGYGLVQWETGELVNYVGYFKESHEILSLYFGDPDMIAMKARYAVSCLDLACTFSMTMALTDATGTIEGEDFYKDQLWVYVCIFVFQILMGIANRLSAIGVTMHNKVNEFVWYCCGVIFFALGMSLLYTNVIASRSCDSPCVAYNYVTVFLSAQVTGWFLVQPTVLTIKWIAGYLLWQVCKDYLTFSKATTVGMAVAKFKGGSSRSRAAAMREAAGIGITFDEFQAEQREAAMEEGGENFTNVAMGNNGNNGGAHAAGSFGDGGGYGVGVLVDAPQVQVASAAAAAPRTTTAS